MVLYPFFNGALNIKDSFAWETVTELFLKEYLLFSNEVDPPMTAVSEVVVTITQRYPASSVSVSSTSVSSTRAKRPPEQRRLDETEEGTEEATAPPMDSLVILFNVDMSYRSAYTDYNLAQLVGSAFDSPRKQLEYIAALQDKSSTFDSVEEAKVSLDGFVPAPIQESSQLNKNDRDAVNIALIVGSCFGALALIILVGLFVTRRRGGDNRSGKSSTEQDRTPTTRHENIGTEIAFVPQGDVSTLGDPLFGHGVMMTMGSVGKTEITARYVCVRACVYLCGKRERLWRNSNYSLLALYVSNFLFHICTIIL